MKPALNINEDITALLRKALTSGRFFSRCFTKSNSLPRWEYVQLNDVQLPDEYDQIYHDLEPFWGMEPKELIALQAEQELQPDSYTLGQNAEGKLEILQTAFRGNEGLINHAYMILEHLKSIEDILPPFRATFSPHDGPNLLTDYGVKSALLEAARMDSCELLVRSSILILIHVCFC